MRHTRRRRRCGRWLRGARGRGRHRHAPLTTAERCEWQAAAPRAARLRVRRARERVHPVRGEQWKRPFPVLWRAVLCVSKGGCVPFGREHLETSGFGKSIGCGMNQYMIRQRHSARSRRIDDKHKGENVCGKSWACKYSFISNLQSTKSRGRPPPPFPGPSFEGRGMQQKDAWRVAPAQSFAKCFPIFGGV